MYIERLEIKGFGKLSGCEFKLRKGLNLIYGPNESGKTTLETFIKAMFYGMKGGKPSGGGLPAPAKRFRPWDGGDYGGVMEYRLDSGMFFRVERNFERNTSEVYDDHFNNITGSFISGKDKSLGIAERHTGLSEVCFEKTVFVTQLGTGLGEDTGAVLAGRLANAGETGFEDVSFKRAENALKNALISRVGTDRSTVRPLDRLNARLDELKSMRDDVNDGKMKLAQARMDLQAALKLKDDITQRIRFLGTVGKLAGLRAQLESRMAAESSMKETARRLQEIEKRLEGETVEMRGPASNGEGRAGTGNKSRILPAGVLFAASVLAAAFGQGFTPYCYGLSAILFAASAAILIPYLLKGKKGRPGKADGLPESGGADRLALILQLKDRQKELYSKASLAYGSGLGSLQELKEAINEAAGSIKACEAALEQELGEIRGSYERSFNDPFDVEKLEEVIYDSSLQWLETTLKSENENAGRSFNETSLKIRELETLLRNDAEDEETLQRIDEEEALLRENGSELERMGGALKLALDVLRESGSEVRRSLAPLLEQRMSAAVEWMTGGRYTDLRIDDRLDIKTVLPETGCIGGVKLLSGGTADQIYLALRLAMADILAPAGEDLPVFMDEVFAQYDDSRIKGTLEFLHEEYPEKQLLLFTCKERELEAARAIFADRLNLIEL